jgi:predicted metal-binding membrane protein
VSAPVAPVDRPTYRLTPLTVLLLVCAALAWAGVVAYARDMGNGPGTMGLSIEEFLAMWGGMMTAMMLPAVAPVASLYSRTITDDRGRRLTLFVGGYLLVWAIAGVPAYLVLRWVDDVGADATSTMRTIAGVILVAAGLYQLSPLKSRCLRHCRSPLAQLLHYGNVKGPARELRVALHHALFCLGCCWALMLLFVAFGVMNVWVMLALAVIVVGEKLLPRGEALGRVAGAAFLLLAVAVFASSSVADALVPSMDSGGDDPSTQMQMDG